MHPRRDGALTKGPKRLTMLLTVEDGGFEQGRIEALGNPRQTFEEQGRGHHSSRGTVEGKRPERKG